jgi:hypothetical protein
MVLRVQPVPNPARGADWSYTIPGQYVFDVTSIKATLTAHTTDPTSTPDQSGNGHTGTYHTNPNAVTTYGVSGPFGGSPNLAVDQNPAFLVTLAAVTADNSAGPFDLATFTYEAIIDPRNTGPGSFEAIVGIQGNTGVRDFLAIHRTPPNSAVGYFYSGNNVNFPGGSIVNGTWSHVALTYDGANWRVYVNGVLTGTSGTGVPDVTQLLAVLNIAGNTVATSGTYNGGVAAAAVFSGALPGANIANHQAAIATSAAAYKAACLADSPVALWLFGEQSLNTGRTVALTVTDGTHIVTEIAPPDVAIGAAGLTYTWAPSVTQSATSPDGVNVIVSTPELILPAGYTVGTTTLDLAARDQWSNINIWWDDRYSNLPGGPGDLTYRNTLLLPAGI